MGETNTRIAEIWPDTYLLSTDDENRGLAFNQYVVDAEEPLLIHTGGADMVEDVVDGIERILPIEELSYALATHFEADECGALSALLARTPDLRPVGSETTARQLAGFDIHDDTLVRSGGDDLDLGDRTLRLLDYPAEMHLWLGLLAYDPANEGLFSSDVFRRRGTVDELLIEEPLALDEIPADRCPADGMRADLAATLADLGPRFVAPGHGPVIERR